jgi:hypothetical protein
MILEGIVTTLAADGSVNIAPMGPRVDAAMRRLLLRPFQTAQTYRNLKDHPEGVFHVTDDVLFLAQAAIGVIREQPELLPATKVKGRILASACRWYEFRIVRVDDAHERAELEAEVVASGSRRDYFGFNRAKHAVVEAAILATRVHLLPRADILAEFRKLKPLVEKTGGPAEHEAFALLLDYVTQSSAEKQP